MRVPFETVKQTIKAAMLKAGLSAEQAETCATVHAESSRDGVYSHGLNRVPRFVDYVKKGWVNKDGAPTLAKARGCAENYDGNLGIGILNAKFCMGRAVALAKEHGVGMVALRNTTHWMRGGTYAWQAADAGYMAMCWTNTESNMPVWGAKNATVGNNPFCIGIPCRSGNMVLDMAMSQYAYGKLEVTRLAGKQLPYAGGFDTDGNLTTDPGAIEESLRILPIGYWKGSGFAVALDMAAALLANGNAAPAMDTLGNGSCGGCCQVFIAFDPYLFSEKADADATLESCIAQIHNASPVKAGARITYPGERTADSRIDSMENGVEVDERVWAEVCALS